MNVTEKQKQILINFMCNHPDFGRGRLRYNRENKRKLDQLWEEITTKLNCTGSGPRKSSKEWAKTWRDWKSNLLKRVATYKSYAASTGGGPPKTLDLTPSEEDLLAFLTPDASGMSNIPEGGAIDLPLQDSSCATSPREINFEKHYPENEMTRPPRMSPSSLVSDSKYSKSFSNVINDREDLKNKRFSDVSGMSTIPKEGVIDLPLQDFSRATFSREINFEKHYPESEMTRPSRMSPSSLVSDSKYSKSFSNVINDREDFSNNISSSVSTSSKNLQKENVQDVENVQDTQNVYCNYSIKNKRLSNIEDINKKKRKIDVKNLFEQHTSDYHNVQEQILQVEKEKLSLAKEKFKVKKEVNKEKCEILTAIMHKVDNLTNIIQSFVPQYLEEV